MRTPFKTSALSGIAENYYYRHSEIVMYDNLLALGIEDLNNINGYSLCTEKNRDVLKINFRTSKGHFFKRTQRFIYPRQHKVVTVDSGTGSKVHMTEISSTLRYVIQELDQIACH